MHIDEIEAAVAKATPGTWTCNCAGEIFVEIDGQQIRIGHFQGTEAEAAAVCALKNNAQMLIAAARSEIGAPRAVESSSGAPATARRNRAWIVRRYLGDELIHETVTFEPMSDEDQKKLSAYYRLEVIEMAPIERPAGHMVSDTPQERFCDANCTILDHQPGCAFGDSAPVMAAVSSTKADR